MMKKLNELLTSSVLKPILEKIQELTVLNQIWSGAMPEWKEICQIANYENGVLILKVESAAFATRIRYAAPEILKKITVFPEFTALRTIECRIC